MNKEWLPIGSIVKIDDIKVIVSGYEASCKGKYYRYAGFIYPMGIYKKDEVLFFNPSSIKEVLFEGYKFNHYNEVVESLKEAENKIKEEQGF